MKNFSIFKNTHKKEGSTAPDYKMSINVGTKEEANYVECGACWLKDGKSGKYFSCKLSDAYADHVKGVARQGFKLIQEGSEATQALPPIVDNGEKVDESQIPF